MLSINDKDYSITFGLYFSVEWVEPRLNLSQDVWGQSGDSLVPGNHNQQQKYFQLCDKNIFMSNQINILYQNPLCFEGKYFSVKSIDNSQQDIFYNQEK